MRWRHCFGCVRFSFFLFFLPKIGLVCRWGVSLKSKWCLNKTSFTERRLTAKGTGGKRNFWQKLATRGEVQKYNPFVAVHCCCCFLQQMFIVSTVCLIRPQFIFSPFPRVKHVSFLGFTPVQDNKLSLTPYSRNAVEVCVFSCHQFRCIFMKRKIELGVMWTYLCIKRMELDDVVVVVAS